MSTGYVIYLSTPLSLQQVYFVVIHTAWAILQLLVRTSRAMRGPQTAGRVTEVQIPALFFLYISTSIDTNRFGNLPDILTKKNGKSAMSVHFYVSPLWRKGFERPITGCKGEKGFHFYFHTN